MVYKIILDHFLFQKMSKVSAYKCFAIETTPGEWKIMGEDEQLKIEIDDGKEINTRFVSEFKLYTRERVDILAEPVVFKNCKLF